MNALENRLTEALHARAEQVRPEDLTPALVPATVSPIRRRVQVGAGIAAAAAVAAVAVVAVGVMTDDDGGDTTPPPAQVPTASDPAPSDPAPSDPAPSDPAPPEQTTPVAPTTDGPFAGLLPADPVEYVEPGSPITLRSGATAVVQGGRLDISGPDLGLWSELEGFDTNDSLDVTEVDLDGNGAYLVTQTPGGESVIQKLYVPGEGGALTEVEAPGGDVPFGTNPVEGLPGAFYTWVAGDGTGLYTRIQVGDVDGNRFEVHSWALAGPGEGTEPESPVRTIVPTTVGTGCYDTDSLSAC